MATNFDIKSRTTEWVPSEYARGYRARLASEGDLETLSRTWRLGWKDADFELAQSLLGQNNSFPKDVWAKLYDIGCDSRICGIPFFCNRTKPWQQGWADTDLNLTIES